MRKLILHFHIFKNAGTSVDVILEENLGRRWKAIEFPFSSQLHWAALKHVLDAQPNLLGMSSHSFWRLPSPKTVEILPILFLRHPIDRLVSAYEFERRQNADTFGSQLARELSFRGYVEAQWRTVSQSCSNFQSIRLAALVASPVENLSATARTALRTLPFVGLVDAFDVSMRQLQSLIEQWFPSFQYRSVRENANPERLQPLEQRLGELRLQIGSRFYDKLLENNSVDVEIYRETRHRYDLPTIAL